METRILQSCLSQAWGGLEMVAFETAIRLHDGGIPALTAVLPGSPLAQKLSARGLRTLELTPGHKYFSLSSIRKIRRTLNDEKITTVLIQQLRDLWYVVPALIFKRNIRLVGIAHMWIDVRKRDLLHRWLYGRLYRLVALTESHKQNLRAHLPLQDRQFTILPNTVDSRRFNPKRRDSKVREQLAPNSETLLIGVVSRLDPKKGLLDVVAAAEQLKAQTTIPFKIVIVGSETKGEERFKAKLQAEIDRHHLQNEIQLIGHRADIEAVMASLDVLLMPSPEETFGRVLIEAMASGVAVVASAGGGVKDVVDHRVTGLLVAPGDTKAMAAALKLCFEDPKLRHKMAEHGLRKAQTVYDPETVDREFLQLLL